MPPVQVAVICDGALNILHSNARFAETMGEAFAPGDLYEGELAHQIAAEEQLGDRCFLDRRGLLIADRREGIEHFRGEAEARDAGAYRHPPVTEDQAGDQDADGQ